MRKTILFSLLSLACCLVGAEEDAISSQEASYDGAALHLLGNVTLDHAFGTMTSQEATLDKAENDKEFPFSRMVLEKDVIVHIASSGKLTCDEASLDFCSFDATFQADSGKKVIFEDQLGTSTGRKKDFYLEAPAAFMKIGQVSGDEKKRNYYIQSMEISKNALLKWDNQITIEAPRLIFSKPDPEERGKSFLGEVMAYADETTRCILRKESDCIYADRIQFDIGQEMIALANAEGIVESIQFFNQSSPIKFKADKLFWDQKKNILTLQDHVRCEDKIVGFYSTDKSLTLFFEEEEGKKQLKSLHALGPTELLMKDEKNHTEHRLFCPGVMDVHNQDLQAVLTAGVGEQIEYSYTEGVVYANKATIDYSLIDGRMRPVSIQLKGEVTLVSNNQEILRCCRADRIQTSLDTQSMVMYAESGKKVLFFDEERGLNISALEVHITKDPQTRQEKIQGVGHVRFSFEDEEKEVLRKLHPKLGKKYE